jgi:hypothetical protein
MTLTETRKKRWRSRAYILVFVALAAFVFAPAVTTPLFLDDHLQGAMVEGTFPAPRGPLNLYDFVDDGDRAALTARGLLPWWSDPSLKIRFLRPLSSALLWCEHRIFSHHALPMHLHSVLWWGIAVLAVRALYTRFFSARVTAFATVMFALAPCHALPLAWIANRETLVSLVFGALAIAAQARWRVSRSVRDAAVALVWFSLALLGGGEYALCFGGYVLGMDIVRREGVARRVTGWLPFVVPALVYLVIRQLLGYGTAGSGFYSDPIRDTASFLATAPWRMVALFATGWLTIDAEPWRLGFARVELAIVVVVLLLALVVPLRRTLARLSTAQREPATWLLVGSLVAFVPILAVVPAWRLLGASAIGVSAVVALLLDHVWFPAEGEPRAPRGVAASLTSLAALGLGFAHLVHGPGIASLGARRHNADATDFQTRVAWVREKVGDPARAAVGVMRGTPAVFFMPFALDRRGVTPATWSVLAQPGHVLVQRRDARTFELSAATGRSLIPYGERNLYRAPSARMREGDVFRAAGLTVTILEVNAFGPRAARFELAFDPEPLFWLTERFEATTSIALPDVGFGEALEP